MDIITAVVIVACVIVVCWTVMFVATKWAEVREKDAEYK